MELAKLKECLEKHLKWLKGEDGGERANFDYEDLRGASLDGASLDNASLRGASLDGASLDNASLDGASLRGASLVGASLRGASLDGASLDGASLDGASLAPELVAKFFPLACPEDGAFIAWKKCGDCIVKLLIPADALRSSAFGRKCRASKAECLEIQNIDGTQTTLREVHSGYDHTFVYRIGQMATVENFDTDRTHECAPGIHFFITRQEAVDY